VVRGNSFQDMLELEEALC